MRKLPAVLFAVACLSSGAALAQSVQTTVDDNPNGRVVRKIYRNGAFTHAESDIYGRNGHRCHISSEGIRTPFGMRGQSHRRCN